MLVAPLLSRWQQTHSAAWVEATAEAMCTGHGLQGLPLPAIGAVPAHAAGHDHDAALPHAQACDYCVLAARLLPVLALLLLALRGLRQDAPPASPRPSPLEAVLWRAHPARGPPLFS